MSGAADWLARVRGHEARGELLLAYDTALQGLAEHPDDLWLAHRAVLNLAKAGHNILQLESRIAADPRFADVRFKPFPTAGGSILIQGDLASEERDHAQHRP